MHRFMPPTSYTRWIRPIIIGLCGVGLFSLNAAAKDPGPPAKSENDQWEFLDNGMIRIGVDKSRGACIGFFGESRTKRNVLNGQQFSQRASLFSSPSSRRFEGACAQLTVTWSSAG
jgi:hypothetical protein